MYSAAAHCLPALPACSAHEQQLFLAPPLPLAPLISMVPVVSEMGLLLAACCCSACSCCSRCITSLAMDVNTWEGAGQSQARAGGGRMQWLSHC